MISGSVLSGGQGNENAKSSVRALSIFAYADPVSTTGNSVEFTDSEIDGSVSGTYIASYGGAAEASGTRVTVQGAPLEDMSWVILSILREAARLRRLPSLFRIRTWADT